MLSIPQAFEMALRHHQAGELRQAEQLYRQILEADPRHVDALHLLGLVAYQTGDLDRAIDSIGAAVRLRPDYVEAHSNLGNALLGRGRLDEAVVCYQQAVRLRPNYAEAHNNLGLALQRQGRPEEAVASWRQAVRLRPDYVEALNNLGSALQLLRRWDEAVACYHQAVRLRPDYAEAHNNLGLALQRCGRPEEAAASWRQALQLRPDHAEAHYNLGSVLLEQGRPEEAEGCFRRALQLRPDYGEAHNNLGLALQQQGRPGEAVAAFRHTLQLRPDDAEVHANVGSALLEQGRPAAAVAAFRDALRLKPDFADAHVNLAMTWLLMGDFAHGWPEYEWRWRSTKGAPLQRHFPQPLWDGAPLAGRTILLHAEQGLGDVLHFIRYAPLVKERGGRVTVECAGSLARLLAGCPGIDRLVARGTDLPAFDVHAPLLSLPGILGTTPATVPANVPYLFADDQLVEQWRREVGGAGGFKVGIGWQGNPKPDRAGAGRRAIPLAQFRALAGLPGVRLFSLQKGPGAEQLHQGPDHLPVTDLGPRLDETAGAFMDTAAVMRNLDLVVSSDTALAHLAGALGVPVWVALPFAPHWCWQLGRADSPWYPTMRLFRQAEPCDWSGVFARMAEELGKEVFARMAQGSGKGP
jgi:tetratricopeptide (TPR) repeat protein